ncbi:hypothetical protein PSE_3430 [Pseudovibrio sp. FO-BEG1]|uniref:hypothetical protein n=1 Tax=Pseudovibrio sp. (strain FO-BEG1) TaxID=911045 RepID=UPI000238CBA4|nr:hypothetical protein [Pseudovibrio sp. FO-BEG1]AEV37936.1 hypothetical protein PSE_3430 [Pseudovibrio sp. FO-BEG1]
MISIAGLIGGVMGIYLGWLNYRLLLGFMEAAINKGRERNPTEKGWVELAEPTIRKVIFTLTIIGIPIIGYLAGASITP